MNIALVLKHLSNVTRNTYIYNKGSMSKGPFIKGCGMYAYCNNTH